MNRSQQLLYISLPFVAGLLTLLAWQGYQNPQLELMLSNLGFCG